VLVLVGIDVFVAVGGWGVFDGGIAVFVGGIRVSVAGMAVSVRGAAVGDDKRVGVIEGSGERAIILLHPETNNRISKNMIVLDFLSALLAIMPHFYGNLMSTIFSTTGA